MNTVNTNNNEVKFVLAFDAGAKGTRYIDNENSRFGTSDSASAKQFDTKEDAQAFNDEHSYLCWVDTHEEEVLTYDVYFDSDTDSNNMGFTSTLEYCQNWVNMHNDTNHSYFKDYKGGTVSIRCNETELTVLETEVL